MVAEGALYGLPVLDMLETRDPVKQELYGMIIKKAREHSDKMREDLAQKTANRVWKSLKLRKGKK